MKQLIFLFAFLLGLSFLANAQTAGNKAETQKAKTTQMVAHGEKGHTCDANCKNPDGSFKVTDLKDHVCTEACHAAGKCVLAHGEKGHVCDASCASPTATNVDLKDHVCTEACHAAGKCVLAHGEKGHVCDANCKKM
ncbi:MAG: hypothetical protein HY842_12530 [Bacteroidetes bacterium]|nr:hypothetical protein [Bacteroidota bacterium]